MLIHRHIVRQTATIIAEAADGALTAYREDRTGGEDDFTGRMLGAIEQEMQNRQIKGVLWTSKTLKPHKGRSAEEKRHGADFLGVDQTPRDSSGQSRSPPPVKRNSHLAQSFTPSDPEDRSHDDLRISKGWTLQQSLSATRI